MRPKGNVGLRPLKWTVESVGREFKLAATSAQKILHQGGAEPAADGTYTTAQVCECLFGNLHAQKVLKEKELVRKYANENRIIEGAYLDKVELMKVFSQVADEMKYLIMACTEMPQNVREDVLHALASIPIGVKGVVERQTRLPRRSKNGREEEITE